MIGVLASCGQWGVALPLGCINPKCGLRILRIEKEREIHVQVHRVKEGVP